MADTKITDLGVGDRFTLEPTDVGVVVDISDTSMAASGTDLQSELQELVAAGAIGALGLMKAADAGMMRYRV